MNVRNKKFMNGSRRIMACVLALLTAVLMVPLRDVSSNVLAAEVLKPVIYHFNVSGKTEEFIIPETGWYTIDLYGGSGGNTVIAMEGQGPKSGGLGGHVKAKYYFTKGEIIYINIGDSGHGGVSSATYLPVAGGYNGGGDATSVYFASGGGASDIRLGGTGLDNRIMVAGGGGGSSVYQHGKPGGSATSGNNGVKGYGTNGASGYSGGGGGYYGGASGSANSQSYGGSNYINNTTHNCSVIANNGGVNNGGGQCIIVRESNYNVTLKLDGGYVSGSNKDISYSYTGTQVSNTYNYTGSSQTYTVPEDGYYELTVVGASGGGASSGGSRGGYGGYSKGTVYLTKGTVLYINVGGAGCEGLGVSPGGWNGGGDSCDYFSGSSGGGATDISLAWSGSTSDWNNTAHLYSRLIVAGGGGGSDNTEAGSYGKADDGSGGYGGGLSGGYPTLDGIIEKRCAPGTETSGYAFGYGQPSSETQSEDGGGAGGGWYGGYASIHCNCGGAGGSGYIWTSSTAGYYPSGRNAKLTSDLYMTDVESKNGYKWGDGYATIRLLGLYQRLPSPTRDGYTFTGWSKVSGNGSLISQDRFQYAEGNTVLKANWTPVEGYSELDIDPNGGAYQDLSEMTIIRMKSGQSTKVVIPERYGWVFTGWTYELIQAGNPIADSWKPMTSDDIYSGEYFFGYESKAKLTAKWSLAKSNLSVDPNGGEYEGSRSITQYGNLTVDSDPLTLSDPTRTGYIFQYWEEIKGSDGYVLDGAWHAGSKDGYLRAVWKPITYTVHYEPNQPEGLVVSGTQPDQTHTYDESKALATNAEYNEAHGYSIPNVKFLWWNTEPDGSGTTYKSGQVVKNLTNKQDDVITLYAQWMVTYTVEHYKQNLDGSYTLADTDEYKLVPLTKWTAPLHDYPGWSQPESNEFIVGTTDATLKFHYPLIHYKLTYDTQDGEWYEEQPDGTWISVTAPPSEYTVLTPDIHVTRPDKVGYTFLGWTGTDVPNNTLDVVIPMGSLGDRSFTAHWEAQAYDVDVPVSVLFSVDHEGNAIGEFDQNGNGSYDRFGYVNNNSLFPVQMTSVTFENDSDYVFTHKRELDVTHPNIMNWRLDIQNGGEWNQYAPELLKGINTADSDIFWMAQNSKGQLKMNVDNAWAIHNNQDLKTTKQLGRIVWTFDIGHRKLAK